MDLGLVFARGPATQRIFPVTISKNVCLMLSVARLKELTGVEMPSKSADRLWMLGPPTAEAIRQIKTAKGARCPPQAVGCGPHLWPHQRLQLGRCGATGGARPAMVKIAPAIIGLTLSFHLHFSLSGRTVEYVTENNYKENYSEATCEALDHRRTSKGTGRFSRCYRDSTRLSVPRANAHAIRHGENSFDRVTAAAIFEPGRAYRN